MRQFARLSDREAKEAVSAQLERLRVATGSEERRAREVDRRKQLQLQHAKALIADEHHQLALKWRLGLRPWLHVWRRAQNACTRAGDYWCAADAALGFRAHPWLPSTPSAQG